MSIVIIAGIFGWILVYPALLANHELRAMPAYKILLSLGINDLLGLLTMGTTGFVNVRTDKADAAMKQLLEVLSHLYFSRWITLGCHIGVMAFNRCVVLLIPRWKWLFEKRKYIYG